MWYDSYWNELALHSAWLSEADIPGTCWLILQLFNHAVDRLCGIVVRVPGYRSRGLGFDSRSYRIFWEVVSLERGSLNLVRIIEEFLKKVAAPV
jgi:hypothetical protein